MSKKDYLKQHGIGFVSVLLLSGTLFLFQSVYAEQKESKPISDEMLEYATEEGFFNDNSTWTKEQKVDSLNKVFKDPELGLQSMKNIDNILEGWGKSLEEVKEKLYIECTVNKESGQFNKTIDCMKWASENAAIPIE